MRIGRPSVARQRKYDALSNAVVAPHVHSRRALWRARWASWPCCVRGRGPRRRARRHAGQVSRRQILAEREGGQRTGRRGAPAGGGHSGGARRQSPHDRSRRSDRRLQDRRRRALNAKTGAPVEGVDAAAFKKVRVNNAVRSAIQGAMGSLTLASPDPEKRLKAAEDVFSTHDAKALPALQAQLAKESDPRVAAALKLAEAAIFATSDAASTAGPSRRRSRH